MGRFSELREEDCAFPDILGLSSFAQSPAIQFRLDLRLFNSMEKHSLRFSMPRDFEEQFHVMSESYIHQSDGAFLRVFDLAAIIFDVAVF